MKVLFAALTAVLLLSITSATYAHEMRHERERVSSRNDAPVVVKFIFDNTRGSNYGMHQHDQRYKGKKAFMRNKVAWKKMKHMQRMNDRYARNDRHDRHVRDDRHNGHNWYDQYFQ